MYNHSLDFLTCDTQSPFIALITSVKQACTTCTSVVSGYVHSASLDSVSYG